MSGSSLIFNEQNEVGRYRGTPLSVGTQIFFNIIDYLANA